MNEKRHRKPARNSGKKERAAVCLRAAGGYSCHPEPGALCAYVLVFYIIRELTTETVDFELIHTYIIKAVIAAVVSMMVLFLSGILSHIAAFNILFELRRYITDKVGKMPMGYLTNRNSGALKKILSDDVERIENFIAHQIPDFVKGVTLPLITIIYLFSQDGRLAAISFVPLLVLAVLIPKMYGGKNREQIQNYHQSLEDMNAGISRIRAGHAGHENLRAIGRNV